MGTSMRKAVFTESVVVGLKNWKAKAKKNLALDNKNYLARPSLDDSLQTSLDTSLENSPSFALDASFSVKFDGPSESDPEFGAVEIENEEQVKGRQREGKQKVGSFDGFTRGTPRQFSKRAFI
jgi:mlo protein